ncbi:AfsR/SARP family transcriptional regulator [Streptomyces geranii]|uniref:AfsR/SARP family transcriptional regulator n=1 Tax=Streptomyces geranii TaxID=2058923 RepID=UPI0018E55D16|nr:BTAD domain-containing putative transcriptional regulator [Streptomyces geranii]
MGLRFQLFGQLRAWRGDAEVDLGQLQQRVVLAVLLLNSGRPVGRERLMDAVWGGTAPARAANLLQRHASGLRRALEPERSPRAPSGLLTWTEAGYLLTLGTGRLDLRDVDRLIDQAHAARAGGDLSATARALHAALDLWQGRLCEGMSSPLLDAERDRFEERRLSVLEERIEADLLLGDDFDLVGEVRRLTVEHPLREGLHGLLMLALHRGGRQAEALAVYHHARRLLRDELGIEPGQRLRRLHARILAADPELDAPHAPDPPRTAPITRAAPPPMAEPTTVVPAQLPHPMAGFVGREDALAQLDALLPGGPATADVPEPPVNGGAVVITAIGGTAGVGKTTLAVHWAHRIRARFPDGQLYVNLRGYDPSGSAMKPAEAIRGFLDALGVPPHRIPVDLNGQLGLYRSLLANRRMLVVLDNAHDADQVRPLLPGSPDCFSVVTSRDRLTGLIATDGATPVALDLMSRAEATGVLGRRIGAHRLAADPEALRDIITSCARLPLALAVVAARAATHPQFPLAALAKELHASGGPLSLLDGGDEATNVRRVFSWSYRRLSAPAARLFRLLGLHPGPDLGTAAVSGLAGLPPAEARPLLTELTESHLLSEPAPGRFTLHDLLRDYAAELALTHDPLPERNTAVRRMLDHYLHSAHRASLHLNPHRDDPLTEPLPEPAAGPVVGEDFADHQEALTWFTTEHAVLLAVQERAVVTQLNTHVWQLAWTLMPYFDRGGHWQDSVAVHRRALEAARRQRTRRGRAVSHGCLAYAYMRLSRYEDVATHLRRALDLYEALGDPVGQAHAHRTLAWLGDREGRYEEALVHTRRSLLLFESAGHRTGQARALNALGWFCSQQGRHEEGLRHCERALRLQEATGDRFDQADTWDSLGRLHHRLSRFEEAAECYRRALDLYREKGDRYNEADTLSSLGDVHLAARDAGAARAAWTRALTLLEGLDHREASGVRAKLDGLYD